MPTYLLDGVPLDHPSGCWTLKKGTERRPLPGTRTVKLTVPGRAGTVPIVGMDREETTFGLTFKVTSATPSGTDGGYQQMERNLEALSALLGVRHRLLQLRYEAGSIVRVADVQITATSKPEVNTGAATARLTSIVEVPGVYWRSESEFTWAGSANEADQVVTTLAGSTGEVTDAVLRWTGPAVNPTALDVATGGAVARPGGLMVGQRLIIDCGLMRAAVVATDTWNLDAGTDVSGSISATGPGSAFRWLHLVPDITAGDPFSRPILVTSSATSTTGASLLEIRARRSYL